MSNRQSVAALATDIASLVAQRCREEGVSDATQRLVIANQVVSEFALLTKRVSQSLDDHGEVTPKTFREMRETVRDIAVNILGRTDIPMNDAPTSLIAD